MGDIVGTITNVKNFLSTAEVKLSVKPNTPQAQTITLSANRKFSIPGFQRELRWEEHNTKMLLSDLSRGTKFLGNVIITTLIISKKPVNTGKSRDRDTEFTTKLLLLG